MRRNRRKYKKPETGSTNTSDTNADVTNRVFIMRDSIVQHIEAINYHKQRKL